MREIIFRGKSVDSGEWINGSYINLNVGADFICQGRSFNSTIPIKIEVVSETVGQYSGVDDKNGVPMYEGDIVKGAIHWLERYVLAWVGFQDGSFGLFWKRGGVVEFNPFTSLCNVTYEVVGNIYDNDIDKMGENYDFI